MTTNAHAKAGTGMRARVNRRELLLAMGALSASLGLGIPRAGAVDAAIDLNGFRDLTFALTGFSSRDPFLPEAFFEAFSTELAQLAQLHAIVRGKPEAEWDTAIAAAGLGDLAQSLTTAWYTGITGDGDNQTVVSYLDAFVWYAVGYTKPPTKCDTDFGAWAERPPPGRFPV